MATQHTLQDLFNSHLADAPLNLMVRYQREHFYARVVRELGNRPLHELTPDILRAWKLHLVTHSAPGSVRRYMKTLETALRFGVEIGWLQSNPMRTIKKPPAPKGRVRFLTQDERVRLLDACRQSRNPLLYAMVVLAVSTGGRKEEIRCLRWSEVDFDLGVVRFLETKTDLDRAVPLVGEALVILKDLHRQHDPRCPWVFPCPSGRFPMAMESPWKTARAQAGLSDFHFHDLRHTFASYMAMAGATLREIADVLGHTNIAQTMAYSHLLPSHTKSIVEHMMKKFLGDQPPREGDML